MSIFNRGIEKTKTELEKKIGSLRQEIGSEMAIHRFTVQGYLDALTGEENNYHYSYNNYRNYESACKAVAEKYDGDSSWGCDLTGNIIDFRAAVTVSSGPQYKPAKRAEIQKKDEEGKSIGAAGDGMNIEIEAEREMEFCRAFFEANDLNHEAPQDLGREAEIEGRVAVELKWNKEKKQVYFVHYPWTKYKYRETPNPKNPKVIDEISWDAQGTDLAAGSIKGDALVCRRFSGRNSSKAPWTKVMRSLTKIEAIDQAFRDWREIDRLYSAPIPVFEFKTKDDADEFNTATGGKLNMKMKKAWVLGNGTFKYVGPEMAGIDSVEREIMRLACFISGTTGYPLQFLLPDMLSNRSTSENIMESALVHTASERAIWVGFYEELITKAMTLHQKMTQKTALDPNKISISISLMTKEQWDRLTSFWLPAFKDDLVTREAVLPQIPNFNVEEELNRREEADKEQVARVSKEIDRAAAEAEKNAELQKANPAFQGKPQEGQDAFRKKF
jgi:hypothetical protein